jgi:hypothetical protein
MRVESFIILSAPVTGQWECSRSLTKSNAATFRLFVSVPSSFKAEFDSLIGVYLPTRRVLGVSSFGARSCHTILSAGFCEVGVKKEATAVSARVLVGCS